jgi:hypothetical protein
VVAALVEAAPVRLNDNVRVPLVAAALLFALQRYALGQPISLFPGLL